MRKLLLFACMLLVIASCKKDEEINSNPSEEKSEKAKDPVVESIIKFNKQVKDYQDNTASRSSETFTLEEAKDNIVNLFNAIYSEPMERYSQLVTDEFSITLAIDNNGMVSSDEAARVYLQMVEKARKGYKASNLSNKSYKYILVDEVNLTRGDSVTIDLRGRFGTKEDGSAPPTPGFHHDGPFEEGDDWHYVDGMGSCDGTRDGGADKELEKVITERYMGEWPDNDDEDNVIFTNFRTFEFDIEYKEYIFYREDIDWTCIEWQYMNDYLEGEYDVIYGIIPEEEGLNIVSSTSGPPYYMNPYYITDLCIDGCRYESCITHRNVITYGLYNVIGSVIDKEELD